MGREGRYGSSIAMAGPTNRAGRYGAPEEEKQPAPYVQAAPAPVSMAPVKRENPYEGQTISAADPNNKPYVERSIWNRIATAVLPKKAEDYFGLNDPQSVDELRKESYENRDKYYQKQDRIKEANAPVEDRSGMSGFLDSMTDWDQEDIPYYGSGKEAVGAINVVSLFNKYKDGTITPQEKSDLDLYYKEQKRNEELKENIGYRSGEIIKGSLRFMGELLPAVATEILTLGAAPTGDAMVLTAAARAGAKATVQRMLKDKVYKATVMGSIKNMAKKEGILLTKQFGLTAPTNITLGTANRMIGQIDPNTGQVTDEGQPIGEALVNATTGHAVELLTERGGGVTGKILGQMTRPVRNVVVKTSIFRALQKALPNATDNQLVTLLRKSGWNGPMGEWFEERDADVLNDALHAAGLGDQDFTGLTMDQITSEIIAFSVMGGGHAVTANTAGKLFPNQEQKEEVAEPIVQNVIGEAAPRVEEKTVADTGTPQGPTTFYSGAKGEVAEVQLDLSDKMVVTIQGDQKVLTNSKSYVEADQKLFEKYGNEYEFIKIEHPEMPSKADEYYDLQQRRWYSQDKDVAEVYAKQNREAKYEETKDMGPGYKKFSDFVDTMASNSTIHPEEVPILKTLFENTNDEFLNMLNFSESAKLKRALGSFHIKSSRITGPLLQTNKFKMQKGIAAKYDVPGSKTFTHEYGHAGWYMILSEEERNEVRRIYKGMTKAEQRRVFSGHDTNHKYYAKNAEEFWAQSFSDYLMENKVSDAQMEPLLKRVATKFFEAIKKLVNRENHPAVEKMRPLFEKILSGDPSALNDLANLEPPSFKQKIIELFNKIDSVEQAPVEEAPQEEFPTGQGVEVPTGYEESLMGTEAESPLDAAEQLYESAVEVLPPDMISTLEPLEVVVASQKRTPVDKKISVIDKLRTPWRVMKKLGAYEEYRKLIGAYEGYLKELPGNIDKITDWSKRVSGESNERIFRSLDGETIELTQEEAKVAGEVKAWLAQWADRLGMSKDERISDYITHIFPRGKAGEIPEEIATLIRNKTAKSIYNPFQLQRQGAEGYLKDTWKALDAYAKRATRKVNIDPALKEFNEATAHLTEASQIEYIEKRISTLNMRPTAMETDIDNLIHRIFPNIGPRPTLRLTAETRKMVSRAKIGGSLTSLAKNLTQGINTWSELGTKYTTRGYVDLAKFGMKELKDNSVLRDSFYEDRTYNAIKKWAEKADRALFMNMEATELINRGSAYYGAKAKFLEGKTSDKDYNLAFGKDKPDGYTPTMEDAIKYGKFVAEKTQFLFGPLETPHYTSGGLAKAAVQFQTFAMKQTEYIWQMGRDKEFTKLSRYLIGSSLLFQYIAGAVGMTWEDSWKTWRWGMPPIIQFLRDLWDQGVMGEDKYGNKLGWGERAKGVGQSLFTNVVPGGAQMKKTYQGFNAVKEGAEKTSAGRTKYKIEQDTGNYIRGTLFGKYNLPESKAYYKEQEEKAKERAGGGSSRGGSRAGRY